jgi:hypothetical protein
MPEGDRKFHRIKIVNPHDNPDGHLCEVTLDGKPLFCRELHLSVTADGLSHAVVVMDAVVEGDLPAAIEVYQEPRTVEAL